MTFTFAALKAACDFYDHLQESPPNSNHIRIWDDVGEPDFQGAPYCAAGVSAEHKRAGKPLPPVDHPWGFSYCPDAVVYAKRNGLWDADGHYEPGDTVLYDWNGDGVADHTETYIKDSGNGSFEAFGCNTSADGTDGSRSNGDGCYYVTRWHGPTVMGVWKTSRYFDAAPKPAPAPVPPRNHTNPFPVPTHLPIQQGQTGDGVRYVQWAASVPVDGAFGPQTAAGVRTFQRFHRDSHGKQLVVDGIVGPLTLGAMRAVVHH